MASGPYHTFNTQFVPKCPMRLATMLGIAPKCPTGFAPTMGIAPDLPTRRQAQGKSISLIKLPLLSITQSSSLIK